MQRFENTVGIIEDDAERNALFAAVDAKLVQMRANGRRIDPYYGECNVANNLNCARFALKDAGIAVTASALIWADGGFLVDGQFGPARHMFG